ncbi:CRISPR-associated protein Cas4 [Pelovirga terrestris]|uniref:CRISPR-associated exonuclease Cas4 n=1 Tax=Pelovirga terrestris TaxID=2771352 RepID=A0A8J6R504_9BACT|nr:CRISPR-associated protein Cas4 [Pelovirga terrestris]MBD1399819.1 CRISPR-associated protein Cas4 [Pelovirga terrestris]
MYAESDYIMISALQHYLFCPRQCALIHIEQLWAENRYTAEGRVLHERADSGKSERTGSLRVVRTLSICSAHYGLSGQADVVEFHDNGSVLPVEYKRGRPKADSCDEVQLCAQALCLEEMLKVEIPQGALYYGQKRRRKEIALDKNLRGLTSATIQNTHQLIAGGITPKAIYSQKCEQCSLLQLCMPKSCQGHQSVTDYLARALEGLP